MLDTEDLIKLDKLFTSIIKPFGQKLENLETKFDSIKDMIGLHSDLLVEIKDRLDRSQLPLIINQVNQNTKEIKDIKEFIRYTPKQPLV